MAEGAVAMAFYTSRADESVMNEALAVCEDAGFEVAEENKVDGEIVENQLGEIFVEYDQWRFDLHFEDDKRPPEAPLLMVGCGQKIYPTNADNEAEYQRKMEAIFELFCRLAVALDADYAPLFNPVGRSAMPEGRPILDTIGELPRMAVYSDSILDDFGSINALYDTDPWYTATLTDGKTVVVETREPWADGGWHPPVEAAFIESASFTEPPETEGARRGFSDPFATLAADEYGTDVCVPRDEISPSFPNEDIELVRVYVDENRHLRRVEDDTFVRNVVDEDPGDDMAFVKAMLADVPADADSDGVMVSALLDGLIPDPFVRLDDPHGENVVTAVMALGTDVSKFELLRTLGQFTHQEGVSPTELQRVVGTLDGIGGENIDQYLRERLL